MIHKTCSINYGHLADLQKFATDHNKKNFHLIKYLLATFIFFPFFSICTCLVLTWDLMWITSMGNHVAVGGISERRHSSCSSYIINHPLMYILQENFITNSTTFIKKNAFKNALCKMSAIFIPACAGGWFTGYLFLVLCLWMGRDWYHLIRWAAEL